MPRQDRPIARKEVTLAERKPTRREPKTPQELMNKFRDDPETFNEIRSMILKDGRMKVLATSLAEYFDPFDILFILRQVKEANLTRH